MTSGGLYGGGTDGVNEPRQRARRDEALKGLPCFFALSETLRRNHWHFLYGQGFKQGLRSAQKVLKT